MITVRNMKNGYMEATFTYSNISVDMGLMDEAEAYTLGKGLLEAAHELLDFSRADEASLLACAIDRMDAGEAK